MKREEIETLLTEWEDYKYPRTDDFEVLNGMRLLIGEFASIKQEIPLPPAEGAEEILTSLIKSLGEPTKIHNHIYEIRPYTVEHKTEWWIFHKEVGSGEPLTQWLNKFATLHAQRLAEKMVEEGLKEELIDFGHAMFPDESLQNIKHYVDTHLKSREP